MRAECFGLAQMPLFRTALNCRIISNPPADCLFEPVSSRRVANNGYTGCLPHNFLLFQRTGDWDYTSTYIDDIIYQLGKYIWHFLVKIGYRDKRLRAICLESKEANKAHGRDVAKKLQQRLADLDAADHVRGLAAGKPHPLTGDRQGQFALDIGGGNRLVFEPDEPVPYLSDGGIDWSKVSDITIVFIGDYHD